MDGRAVGPGDRQNVADGQRPDVCGPVLLRSMFTYAVTVYASPGMVGGIISAGAPVSIRAVTIGGYWMCVVKADPLGRWCGGWVPGPGPEGRGWSPLLRPGR